MTITLCHSQRFALAHEFAREIHSRVIQQHLHLSATHTERATLYPWPPSYSTSFEEVQCAIRSIHNCDERRRFISDIRYHFKRIREENRTGVRGRDYAQRVTEYRAEHPEVFR